MTDTSNVFAAAKKGLRASCTTARDAIPAADRERAAERIAETGIGFATPPPGAMVSAYSPMGAEMSPASLHARLARDGYCTCLPVVTPLGYPLIFRAWRPGDELVAGVWGIQEPADAAPVVEPDVVLAPLLAFDRRGGRLGYGGGYYDRTIARLRRMKPVIVIGLAFRSQELGQVPCDAHDELLDWVLTENGPIKVER
jgi:5-formyltetrahydrofolate cyclo-ligase